MNHLYRWAVSTALVSAAMTLFTGCTDSGHTGIEGTGDKMAASGSVTAFGSIWVNGIRFDTSGAVIYAGENTLSEQAIQPGMIVQIKGTLDAAGNAHANTVELDHIIKGPITSVEHLGMPYSEIHVLGQTVIIPEDVVLAGIAREDLSFGLTISVSGLMQRDGSVLATRIEHLESAPSLHVEGIVQSIDREQYRLMLGALEVDYSAAQLDSPEESLALGQRLEVEGTAPPGSTAVLTATHVRLKEDVIPVRMDTLLALEGVIEAFVSADSFVLKGVTVDASRSTITHGDMERLGNGVRVTAEGRVNKQGVLVADRVTLLLPSETRFSGMVENVEPQSRRLTLLSTTFNSDSFTAFEDLSPHDNRKIDLGVIGSGDTVEVFGRYVNNEWIATRIRRVDAIEGVASLRGPVGEIISDSTFSVMGVMIDATEAEGADMIASLTPGQFVTVDGVQTGEKAISATRITLVGDPHCPAPVATACAAKSRGKAGESQRP